MTPKLQAVCRAEGWGDWSRCAVRMTAKGSVTPWMACGSRPVEGSPALGGFPDSRHKPGPGIAKGEAFSPLARPRQQQVGKSSLPTRAEPAQSESSSDHESNRHWIMPSSHKPEAVCRAEADSAPCAAPSGRRDGVNEPQGCGESQCWHRDVPSLTVTEGSWSARDQAAVGHTPAAGLLRTAASVLNPPPPSGRLANRPSRQRAERTQ